MSKKKSATPALRTTPWRRRTSDGVYFGHSGAVWAYYELPLAPLKWEDGTERIKQGSVLDSVLTELGETSVDVANGLSALAALREVHIFAASYETSLEVPSTPTEAHRDFLERVLPLATADKTLLVGVKLWNQVKRGIARGGTGGGAVSSMWKQTKTVLARDVDSEDSFAPYRDDHNEVSDLMRRCGASGPRESALAQLESWFNFGNGPDAQVLASPTALHVTHGGTWEIATVTEFERPTLTAPDATWLMDAMTHPDPAVAVSIRAELLPATVLRAQLRTSQRKLRAQEEEEQKTGDISRDEISDRSQLAKDLENRVAQEGRAWMTKASILMARAYDAHEDVNNSYRDLLRTAYGIETKPLEHRQLRALEEMAPCANVRANPFDQTVSIPLVAYAGLPSFSNIGDPGPLWLGEVDPDGAPVFVEAAGAPRNNKPPVMAIFGDPGSGKALHVDEPILTPTGWRRMGDLAVGDAVTGRDGHTYEVLGVYPQGTVDLYTVTFDDGSSVLTCGNHAWSVAPSAGEVVVSRTIRTTAQIAEDLGAGIENHIPLVEALSRPEADLNADPYAIGQRLATPGAPPVDPAYLWSSVAQRRALLAGLLDAAGTARGPGLAGLTLRSEDPVPGVVELVESLGGLVRAVDRGFEAGTDSSDDSRHDSGHDSRSAWVDLAVQLPVGAPNPFCGSGERDRWVPQDRQLSRRVVSVTAAGLGEAQCITVTAPDALYVTRRHLATHNTFAAQLLAGQAALSGTQTILINPKGFQSLRSFSDWVAESGTPSSLVSMSAMEEENGAFDPFRFAEPRMAAEILNRHILTVLGIEHSGGLTGAQEIELGAGLVRGAEAGARCAYDALQYVADQTIIDLVVSQARASSLFRLGFGFRPQPPFASDGRGGLTLIEFDRALPLPEPGLPPGREERIALGAMRLVTRAAMEILMRSGGGLLVVDEAHHYLNSPEGLASLQRMGREGRSLGLLPIFLTQRVTDLLHADMENYLSRVLVMKLTDATQADAALRLCGLKPTKSRIDFLREAGPRAPSNGQPGRASYGFFRDIDDRHAVVSIGTDLPEDIRLAFSTNPDDQAKREALLAEAAAQATPPSEEPAP